MQVQQVPLQFVHAAWPKVERFVASALEYSNGEYTPEQAKVFVAQGQWAVFVAVDDNQEIQGAACVQFNNMPNDRVAFVVAIGGKLIADRSTWEQFTSLLKVNGATYVEGAARESIARLWKAKFGFEEKYRIVGVRI
jgi:hypothetical protein